MVSFKSVITALLLIQISIGVINLTGIFTVQEHIEVVPEETISNTIEKFNDTATDNDNSLDYFAALGDMVYGGLNLALTFLRMAITGVPTVLKLFYVPDALANIIGYAVEALLVLGIAYKLFNR